jgi:hypothetical protein
MWTYLLCHVDLLLLNLRQVAGCATNPPIRIRSTHTPYQCTIQHRLATLNECLMSAYYVNTFITRVSALWLLLQLDAPGPLLVKRIVDQAARLLAGMGQLPTDKVLELPDFAIGLDPKACRIADLLASGGSSRFILLHGMAGMGKTTLAKAVFNQLHQRDNTVPCHFAGLNPEVKRPDEVVAAQQALLEALLYADVPIIPNAAAGRQVLAAQLRGKKVLLVVDNVWGQQLSWLLPGNIMEVLGQGSMVLVTSRESAWALRDFGGPAWVQEVEMDFLTQQESLELFCKHVYGSATYPTSDEEPVDAIVLRCGGLPLSLEVVGSYIGGSKDVWGFYDRMEESLSFVYSNERANRFERQQTVFDALRVSWEALDGEQQEALLDIVWFLQGQPRQLVECVCESGVLEQLACLGLVSWSLMEQGSTQQHVAVHIAVVDFCKLLVRSDDGERLELVGDAAEGCSIPDVLSMVGPCFLDASDLDMDLVPPPGSSMREVHCDTFAWPAWFGRPCSVPAVKTGAMMDANPTSCLVSAEEETTADV